MVVSYIKVLNLDVGYGGKGRCSGVGGFGI